MSFENNEHVRYATNGKANAGLTLGIIGTSLAGLMAANGNGGNGLFGNILGGGKNCQQDKIAYLEARVAELEGMRYTDSVGIDLYKEIVAVAKEEDAKLGAVTGDLVETIAQISKDTALNKQASDYQFALLNQKIDYENALADQRTACCCDKLNARIDCETRMGALSDASILAYVQATYIPGTLKLPITSICPQPSVD
jgi:hypothetical protein